MNIIFIPNIKMGDGRSNPYHYSVNSWKQWSEQYDDVKVIEWDTPILDTSIYKITLQRYWVFDILEYNDIEYDQVLMVDADTIVHPKCPNFFNETNGKMNVVVNSGCMEWVTRSIRNWGDMLFPNEPKIKSWKYFNGGFQIVSKKHKSFYKKVQQFYIENIDEITRLANIIKAGTDQTIINYLTQIEGVELNYLPECYNLQDLFKKNLLYIPKHSWWVDDLIFTEAGWVYHFNAIPQNPRHVGYWLKRTYNELYENTTKKIEGVVLNYGN
jgi:lipopolysaccharide biosynthesis glycosyltransferase